MVELKNEFRWSVSRQRRFQECQRLYYLTYYAQWGGWELSADEFSKTCYRLAKMKNLDTWAGEIVHELILQTLRKIRDRQSISLNALTACAIDRLREGWQQSKNEEWRLDPKRRVNLFEHYYRLDIPRQRTDEIKHRVIQCLENFWHSDAFHFIRQVDPSQWKCAEEFQTFRLENFTIGLKIDFALAHDGWLYIYDWKTGQEDEHDLKQLACSALYGMKTWGCGIDRIKIVLAYLRQNLFQEHHLSPPDIIEAQDQILQGCTQMLARLTDPQLNLATIENFPMTADRGKCRRCSFWEACYGHRRIED